MPNQGLSLARRYTAFGAAFALMATVLGCGSSSSTTVATTATDGAGTAVADCMSKWNASTDAVKNIWTPVAESAEVYAAVGFSAAFPDKCMVTIAVPSTGLAGQFLEGGASGVDDQAYGTAPTDVTRVADLPQSAMQWNARLRGDGTLTPAP